MLNAFLWGLLATSSLIIGGIIASRFTLGRRTLGIIMAFGAGTLISAVSYELIYEAVKLAQRYRISRIWFIRRSFYILFQRQAD